MLALLMRKCHDLLYEAAMLAHALFLSFHIEVKCMAPVGMFWPSMHGA